MRDVSRHMIVIRAASDEVDLRGSTRVLMKIASAVRALKAGGEYRYPADASADPAPYERCLGDLRVVATNGPVRVSTNGSTLVVEGHQEHLDRFASFLALERAGDHSHYEHYEGNPYIASDSCPLVVTCDG